MTIRDLYNDAIQYEQQIIIDILDLLVIEKKVLKWEDNKDKIHNFLDPRYNKRYQECFEEMGRR